MARGIWITMFLLLAVVGWTAEQSVMIDDFEGGLDPRWEEKVFKGKTVYTVVAEGAGKVLRADSRGTASGLVMAKKYEVRDFPLLAWRWKISNVLDKGDARTKAGDDYAARIYVIFPHWFPPKTRSINYIWANKLSKGDFIPNSYFSNAVMLAVESGGGEAGRWLEERRDVLADYRMIFGEDPPPVGAIAIMSDTDNTGETAVAFYDDIRLLGKGN